MTEPLFDCGSYLEYHFNEVRRRKDKNFRQRTVEVYLDGSLVLTVSSAGYGDCLTRLQIMAVARWAYNIRGQRPSNVFIGDGFAVEYEPTAPTQR